MPFGDSSPVDSDGEDIDDDGKVKYRYRPPEHVRKRQFASMALWAGYVDAVDFALVVEGWTQQRRRDCLERFYRYRRGVLAGRED